MSQSKNLIAAILLVCIAFFAQSQNISTDKKETAFSFNDGQTTYTLYKITPNSDVANGPPYYKEIFPEFNHNIEVLDKPVVDTIYDAENRSIILFTETVIGKDFKYALKFSNSYNTLNREIKSLTEMAKDQGLEITQTKFVVILNNEFYDVYYNLPEEEDLAEGAIICVTIRLEKNKVSMKYPILFAN